ncbi:hypothetical protein [Halobacterium sp. CBA1126]|uniref:hypothetical protein n=1 Tax=Halobacterium TaxID=2239 RepID=UPI0012FA4A1B|nr:hypothetical protein [Halobacterium sp. CBA1126]MUV61283.1 hypothetical protein [Halobacterium sp. CBA1126]
MGLIELHFHESEFDFSPSVVTGADEELALEDEDGDDEDVESAGWKSEGDDEADSSSVAGAGAVVALVVLVVLGALVGWKRRGGDEDVELEA